MIESRGFIEQPHERRQVDRKSPFVRTSTHTRQAGRRGVPPWRDAARNRLDNKDSGAVSGRLEQRVDQRRARFVVQFVQHVGCEDRQPLSLRRQPRDIAPARAAIEAQRPVRPSRLINRPRMPIDASNLWCAAGRNRPRRTRGAGAASDVENRGRRRACAPSARTMRSVVRKCSGA